MAPFWIKLIELFQSVDLSHFNSCVQILITFQRIVELLGRPLRLSPIMLLILFQSLHIALPPNLRRILLIDLCTAPIF
ncbi:hypothetical protein CCR75_002183 [Bremia lactucae]|uniref:Uncharacterized protein n=1 Tax=Bremia lactucae TaxID=4779 RepID=A0A976FSN6_BRELC|nr:hypothetical protein CCR75_002183 [Bremia lactucae]